MTRALDELHRARRLPMLEGEERFELVRDVEGWRIFLNWAGGVRVRFRATAGETIPFDVHVTPAETILSPGERVRVTVRARNRSVREVTARVRHAVAPAAQADSLALLQCPLMLPVTLKPGEADEFASQYLLLPDAPADVRQYEVTYVFGLAK